MSRSTLTRLCTLAVGSALFLGVHALPALAETAPASDVTNLTGLVGDHFAGLTWGGGGDGNAIVRDVTGVSGTLTPTSGRSVPAGATSAIDRGFTNLQAETYAVWGANTDGTTSPDAATVTVNTVDPLATTLTMKLTRTSSLYGQKYTVTGTLNRGLLPSSGQVVEVVTRILGTQSTVVSRRIHTDVHGNVTAILTTTRSADVSLHYDGDAFSQSTDSSHLVMNLQPVISSSLSSSDVIKGARTALTGHVSAGLANASVAIERRTSNGWSSVATVHTNSKGDYTYFLATKTAGTVTYRARLVAGTAYLGATSPSRALEVDLRDLVDGDTGSDVLALERKLAALHYSPGKVDTTFDLNTEHAVIAFEKVQGLPRNGTWGKAERAVVAHPKVWKLRYGGSGRHVEVDFTKQILVYSENGVVKYIMDASTGGEYHYTYQGVTYLAHTPRGHFEIQRKIDGVRHSNLGYLYRPSYFTGGYAVHGEDYDVPTYAASHGCVRVTNYNADILFPLLVVGTPIDLYDE